MAGHPGDHIHRRSGGSNSEAQWRVTLGISFIGDLEGQLRGAMAGHTADHIHRRSDFLLSYYSTVEGAMKLKFAPFCSS